MGKFKKFLNEQKLEESVEKIQLYEYEIYKNIPKTKTSYRIDNGDINKNTLNHAHVYSKPKGNGRELYSVNIDGTGHDGSTGTEIPNKHANYFRNQGFEIPSDNILEVLNLNSLDEHYQELIIVKDETVLGSILEKINE